MGAFVGLLAGLGLLLIWHGPSAPAPVRRLRAGSARTREQLIQAGLPGVARPSCSPCRLAGALVAGASAFVVTQSFSVSLIFARVRGRGAPAVGRAPAPQAAGATCANCGPRWSTTSPPACGPGCRCRRRCPAIGARGPEQLREPFRQFGSDYRTTGRFNESLDRLKAALADPVGDRVVESLRVAREVGGTDLGRLLSTLSGFLRDDARTRAELLARQSWSVNAARMAVAAPWLVLILLATQRETLQAYDTPTGTVILVAGAVLSFVAYRLMIRIGRLPEDRRVLR